MARSKEFDIDDVLLKAMTIFWQQGYEKTSMQDLVAAWEFTSEACMTPLETSIPYI